MVLSLHAILPLPGVGLVGKPDFCPQADPSHPLDQQFLPTAA
jgi:hypothetical protein